jgi:ring-1,2-phenylacetyl-CoA epoxidase subunit PaaD
MESNGAGKIITAEDIFSLLSSIPDPEVPAINIFELGVLRKVEFVDAKFIITITPTYSGCPAMHAIEEEIKNKLSEHRISNFQIKTVLFPAWTTDWMSTEAKAKLTAYGIAPPQAPSKQKHFRPDEVTLTCPFCKSENTKLTSWFGSTACKALYYCKNCNQPFEHFKCH